MDIDFNIDLPEDQVLTFMHVGTDESGLPSVEIFKDNMNLLIEHLNEENTGQPIREITSDDIISYFEDTEHAQDVTSVNSVLDYDQVQDYLQHFFNYIIGGINDNSEKINLKNLIETAFNNAFETRLPQAEQPAVQQNQPDEQYEECPLCLEEFNDTATAIKCSNCRSWFHYDAHNLCEGAQRRICQANQRDRLCPVCRTPWQLNCQNQIIRPGPVLYESLAGGRKTRKTKTRKTRKTRKTKTRKTRKTKTTRTTKTRKTKTRRTKKY